MPQARQALSARARLRHHPHAEGHGRARHGAGGQGARAGPRRPRPARPTTTPTRGSSATPRTLVTGVWVGYDRPRSLGKDETGSRVAVPIWTAFMKEALAGTAGGGLPDTRGGGGRAGRSLAPSGACVRPVTMAFLAGHRAQEHVRAGAIRAGSQAATAIRARRPCPLPSRAPTPTTPPRPPSRRSPRAPPSATSSATSSRRGLPARARCGPAGLPLEEVAETPPGARRWARGSAPSSRGRGSSPCRRPTRPCRCRRPSARPR